MSDVNKVEWARAVLMAEEGVSLPTLEGRHVPKVKLPGLLTMVNGAVQAHGDKLPVQLNILKLSEGAVDAELEHPITANIHPSDPGKLDALPDIEFNPKWSYFNLFIPSVSKLDKKSLRRINNNFWTGCLVINGALKSDSDYLKASRGGFVRSLIDKLFQDAAMASLRKLRAAAQPRAEELSRRYPVLEASTKE